MTGRAKITHLTYRLAAIGCLLIIVGTGMASSVASAPMAAYAKSSTSVTLTWTAPGDDLDVGTATAYSIRYSTSVIDSLNWLQATEAVNPPAPQPADSDETFDVVGLDAGRLYYFAIKAVDEVGNWSELSSVISLLTGADQDPPATISDLTVVASEP